MKARIFEIKRFAVHDGSGIRTTVFFKGCPLSCVWCHNPEGISFGAQLAFYENKCIGCGECVKACPFAAHRISGGTHTYHADFCRHCGTCAAVCPAGALTLYGEEVTAEELLPRLTEDRDFYDNSGGGVTLSGGECLCQPDFCAELLRRLKSEGIHTAVDTCGAVPRHAIDAVLPYTDIFLYDIKAIDENVHKRCTGLSNRLILDNLQYLVSRDKDIEVRIPYVPGFNDGEVPEIADFLSGLPHITGVRLLPYHNYAGSKYKSLSMKNTLPQILPAKEELDAAKKCLQKKGLMIL